MKTTILFLLVSLCLFVGCAPSINSQMDQASTQITETLGCADSQSKVFDSFYELIDQTQKIPLASDMKKSLKRKFSNLKAQKNMSESEVQKTNLIYEKFSRVIDLMLSESSNNPDTTVVEQMQSLIEYEMQSRSSEEVSETQKKIHILLKEIHDLSDGLPTSCSTPRDASDSKPMNTPGRMSRGLDMVFATAYQSCRVLDLPVMDSSTPST